MDLNEIATPEEHEDIRWYVMRDLKRMNATQPAYRQLQDLEMEVFVPMTWRISRRGGICYREQVPFISNLLFVHEPQDRLDAVVERIPTLQYRWLRNTWREPMTVRDVDMERFIRAVRATDSPYFYLPGEVTPAMCGRKIRIVGGPLDGLEGNLLTIRGSRTRRLLVELPGLLAVGVDVCPDFIELA